MRAIRRREPSNENFSGDRQTNEALILSGINRATVTHQPKRVAYPEVWGYIRRNQTPRSYECDHCGQSFQTHEQLRRHEIDCIHDETDKPNSL